MPIVYVCVCVCACVRMFVCASERELRLILTFTHTFTHRTFRCVDIRAESLTFVRSDTRSFELSSKGLTMYDVSVSNSLKRYPIQENSVFQLSISLRSSLSFDHFLSLYIDFAQLQPKKSKINYKIETPFDVYEIG